MTKLEFLALKKHARIKYIGKEDLFKQTHGVKCMLGKKVKDTWSWGANAGTMVDGRCTNDCINQKRPKNFLTKGVVVSWVWGDTSSKDVNLYYYGGSLGGVDPSDWTLVDARNWVESETEYKRAKSYIPNATVKFKEDLKNYLEMYKHKMEYKVDDLPIDKKLKIIMELSPEDRKWFGIMTTSPEETLKIIEKAFEEDGTDAT